MYENPKLTRVGKAQEVVLGTEPGGHDVDGNYFVPAMEFAEEEEDLDLNPSRT